jgi:hypothetical protein
MSTYYGVCGWLECPFDFDVALEQELSFLKERYGHVHGFEASVFAWTRPVNPFNLTAYFTFAADLRSSDIENFHTILTQLCARRLGLCGFFYLRCSEWGTQRYLKVEADQVTEENLLYPLYDDTMPDDTK